MSRDLDQVRQQGAASACDSCRAKNVECSHQTCQWLGGSDLSPSVQGPVEAKHGENEQSIAICKVVSQKGAP